MQFNNNRLYKELSGLGDTQEPPEDNEEWYASTYVHFLSVIKLLAEDPEVQCVALQYHNVAWELKADALTLAELILGLPGGKLSRRQRGAIERLRAEIAALPSQAFYVPNTIESQSNAMRDPHWGSIRVLAAELVEKLESESQRVEAVLWPTGKA